VCQRAPIRRHFRDASLHRIPRCRSTLLNALAGQVPRTKGLRLSGEVTTNGERRRAASSQGYVTQDDAFFSQMSVLETLTLAAKLRLPAHVSDARKEALVAALVNQLGLARVAHTRVGGAKVRGISGGERKRLAIACELLASPSLLFCDEPTSGLDAFSSLSVMQSLKALASRGHTVVASIHQPRGSIWELFDDLVVLAEGGQPLYSGPACDAVAHFERAAGVACPPHSNPAEFLLDLAAVDYSSEDAAAASRLRIASLAAAWTTRAAAAAKASPLPGADAAGVSASSSSALCAPQLPWWVQFRLLLQRSWRQVTRDKAAFTARLASSLSSALIFASVFWRLGTSQAAIQSRLGLLQVCAVNAAMSSLVKTLSVFPRERTVVQRERAAGQYGVGPYFLAKLAAELPVGAFFPALFGACVFPACGLNASGARFLRFMGLLTLESFSSSALGMTISALVPSTEAAMATGPAIMVIFIVFGGVYVNQETVPRALRWIPRVSLIKQAFEGLCVNELRGMRFEAAAPGDAATGEQVLRRIAFERSTIGGTVAAQARILLFNWGATYLVLKRLKPRFAALEAPRPGRTDGRAPQVVATLRMEQLPAGADRELASAGVDTQHAAATAPPADHEKSAPQQAEHEKSAPPSPVAAPQAEEAPHTEEAAADVEAEVAAE
jgi:ABC-type multidrug transport system ATPase subunit